MQELHFLEPSPSPVDSELNQPTLQMWLWMMFSNEKEGETLPGEMQKIIAQDVEFFALPH